MAQVSGYLPNGRRAALVESIPYCSRYPVKHFCMECGWFGAEFTGVMHHSHRNRPDTPAFKRVLESHHSQGKCDVCGKEGLVSTPWTFGHPVMTNYLWGPDFIKKDT